MTKEFGLHSKTSSANASLSRRVVSPVLYSSSTGAFSSLVSFSLPFPRRLAGDGPGLSSSTLRSRPFSSSSVISSTFRGRTVLFSRCIMLSRAVVVAVCARLLGSLTVICGYWRRRGGELQGNGRQRVIGGQQKSTVSDYIKPPPVTRML